jgi:UrcA family protein
MHEFPHPSEIPMARPTLAIIAAGLGGWLLASTALAAPATEAATQRISYAELDLNKDAGVERLYARLRHAAEQVCGGVNIRDLAGTHRQEDCVRASLDRAVEDVHSARLTARHRGATAGAQYARLD